MKKWLHSRGRRVCAAVLCGSLVLCSVANGQIAALGSKSDVTDFRLHKVSMYHELEKAVEKGKTVAEDLEFEGEAAGEYEELFAADGSLYELTASAKKSDGLKLRVFARLDGEADPEEAYEIDGSEEIIFLLSNTTDQVKTAVVHVDRQKSEPIRVVPRRAVPTSADAAEEAELSGDDAVWTDGDDSAEDALIPGTVYDAVLLGNHGAVAVSMNAGDLGLDDPKYASDADAASGSNAAAGTNDSVAGGAGDAMIVASDSNASASGSAETATDGGLVATASNALKVYTAEVDGLVVKVTAKNGVVPDGAVLQVKELKEDDAETAEQFREAKEALDAGETEYDGMIALDISFFDEEGNEIEPDGEVSVSIEMKMEVLPEDVNPESLAVQHLAEMEDGTVEVKNVADISEETDGTVAVVEDAAVAEFAVESFSTFTLTWSGTRNTYFQIDLISVDEVGNTISEDNEKVSISTGSYAISNYVKTISGYSFAEARLGNLQGDAVTEFTAAQSSSWTGTTRTIEFYEDGVSKGSYTYSNRTVTVSVYLVYRLSNISILDTIKTDGSLTAEVDPSVLEAEGVQVTYSWQKKAVGSSTWEPVEDVKVGDQYILSEDGRKVNVALDRGARYTYKVTATVTDADGNTSAYEAEYQVPYYDSLQNGSFETPVISSNYSQLSNADYKAQGGVWQTTGVGTGNMAGRDIEILNIRYTMNQYYFWYGTASAVDGNQFAELNAEAEGSLYQDVLTVPGSSLNWWLSHRARGSEESAAPEYDTMYLLIMSTDLAEEYGVDNQAAVRNVIENIADYPGAAYWEFCSDDQEWHYYSSDGVSEDAAGKIMDPYEVPEGQYLTRFFFVAGDTASQSASMGNFLDEVGFGYDLPPARPGTGNLEITKRVVGIDSEAIKDYSVSFTVYQEKADGTAAAISGNPVRISSFTERTGTNQDGSTYTYYEGSAFRSVEASDRTTGTTYLVQENGVPECSGYAVDAENSDKEDKTVIVYEQGTGEVVFTNAYKRSKCTVTVKKLVAGNMGETGDPEKTYSFTYSTEAGESGSFTLTDGAEQLLEVTIGTSLTVTETDSRGYEVTWQRNDGDTVMTADRISFTAENVQQGETITCINTRDVVAPTGIGFNNRPFVLMIAFAVLGLAGSVLGSLRRKRRYRI